MKVVVVTAYVMCIRTQTSRWVLPPSVCNMTGSTGPDRRTHPTLGAEGHSDAAALLHHGDEAGDLELLSSLLIFILGDTRWRVSDRHPFSLLSRN